VDGGCACHDPVRCTPGGGDGGGGTATVTGTDSGTGSGTPGTPSTPQANDQLETRGPFDLGIPLVDNTLNAVVDALSGLLRAIGAP
jgi:hypothetical protein